MARKKVDWKRVGRAYEKVYRSNQRIGKHVTNAGLVGATLGTATGNPALAAGGSTVMGAGILGSAANEAIHAGVHGIKKVLRPVAFH
jgi:hypothetical protein